MDESPDKKVTSLTEAKRKAKLHLDDESDQASFTDSNDEESSEDDATRFMAR